MLKWKLTGCAIAVVAAAMFAGCAPAYHAYQDHDIDCWYCVPPPLPWPEYPPCVCHSEPAQEYLHSTGAEYLLEEQAMPLVPPVEVAPVSVQQ